MIEDEFLGRIEIGAGEGDLDGGTDLAAAGREDGQARTGDAGQAGPLRGDATREAVAGVTDGRRKRAVSPWRADRTEPGRVKAPGESTGTYKSSYDVGERPHRGR